MTTLGQVLDPVRPSVFVTGAEQLDDGHDLPVSPVADFHTGEAFNIDDR